MIARNKLAALSMAGVAMFGLSACGQDAETPTAAATESMTPEESMTPDESMTPEESMTPDESMAPAGAPVGPGCADYASQVPSGEGSVEGMSDDPVAVAASNNPMLTTLTQAVSGQLNPDVDLVNTLNGDQFTVFAPVDSAFQKIDQATLGTLGTDSQMLTDILTYHVVPGQMSPQEVADAGTLTSVQGGTLEVSGQPDNLMVNGNQVICGGVQTANATVYLVDSVLMPS